jgi:OmcA/MtrC family decaheme c-type cytochrome
MNSTLVRLGLMAALISSLAACGSSGGGGVTPAAAPAAGSVAAAAASNPATSNTANNPNASFSLVIKAGLAPVTINSPPVINFAVIDSTGKHVPGLTLSNAGGLNADPACGGANVMFGIAQLQSDNTWRSLISNQQTVPASVAASGIAIYGTMDPVQNATLSENAAAGYYTYHAAIDVTNASAPNVSVASGVTASTNGLAVVKDGATVHRAALQLCYVDPATNATVKVNPYIDFTIAANGTVTPVTDSQGNLAPAKKVVDQVSCNACHQNFAAPHGGNFAAPQLGIGALVEPQVCDVCHNPGSQEFDNNGASIDMKFMTHKFHMGTSVVTSWSSSLLASLTHTTQLTQNYAVGTAVARKGTTGVTFPGEIRNCTKCHNGPTGAIQATTAAQSVATDTAITTQNGDNWMTQPSKNACFACHDNYKVAGSDWQIAHKNVNYIYSSFSLANPDSIPDSVCANCHGASWPKIDMATMHAVPEWGLAANYQYNIWNTTLNADRTVTVEYSISNPSNGTDYDLLNFSQYMYVSGGINTFVFGGATMYIGWGTDDYTNAGAIGRPWTSSCTPNVTCDAKGLPQAAVAATPNTNGAGGALITRGQPVALSVLFDPTVKRVGSSNHFTVTSTPIPASATGSGVAAFAGSLNPQNTVTTPTSSYVVPVTNVVSYFSLGSGSAVPRRTVVATANCEVCHDKFFNNQGHANNPWHVGLSNTVEVCVICHNGNNPLDGTVVSGGAVTQWAESAHLKRMIHMMHKAQAANNNFPAQTALTGAFGDLTNCNMCHANNSYQQDKGVMGTSRTYAVDLSVNSVNATVTETDASNNAVISPKASACSACHDSTTEMTHMMSVGGATFGGQFGNGILPSDSSLPGDVTVTQSGVAAGMVYEQCDGCHASGAGLAPVNTVHGLK